MPLLSSNQHYRSTEDVLCISTHPPPLPLVVIVVMVVVVVVVVNEFMSLVLFCCRASSSRWWCVKSAIRSHLNSSRSHFSYLRYRHRHHHEPVSVLKWAPAFDRCFFSCRHLTTISLTLMSECPSIFSCVTEMLHWECLMFLPLSNYASRFKERHHWICRISASWKGVKSMQIIS